MHSVSDFVLNSGEEAPSGSVLIIKSTPLRASKGTSAFRHIKTAASFLPVATAVTCAPINWHRSLAKHIYFTRIHIKHIEKLSIGKSESCILRYCLHSTKASPWLIESPAFPRDAGNTSGCAKYLHVLLHSTAVNIRLDFRRQKKKKNMQG